MNIKKKHTHTLFNSSNSDVSLDKPPAHGRVIPHMSQNETAKESDTHTNTEKAFTPQIIS